jgi:replication-associated recombination protein RarA
MLVARESLLRSQTSFFCFLSAINSGVKDIKDVIEKQNKAEVFYYKESRFYL